MVFLKISQKSQESTYVVSEPFFNNVAGLRPVTLLKIDSDKVAFLKVLKNFYKHLFHRTPPVTAFELICS